MSDSDRIEKEVVIRAPRSRVWAAIADSKEFGTWFHCRFEGAFEVGRWVRAAITEPGAEWDGVPFVVYVERVEPEHHLSFRWHQHEVDPDGDFADEPTTLVTFDLEDAADGTLLRIAESGFDALPDGRAARERNAGGWEIQAQRISTHVEGEA